MCASPRMACLDSIYYKLRSNAAWLMALGMCLQIKGASHETALWFTRRYRDFTQRVTAHCFLFATLLALYI